MNKIFIDKKQCTKCGKCIKVCGAKVIEMQNNEIAFVRDEMCISCGHCVAICESDALKSNPEDYKHFEVSVFDKNLPKEQLIFREKHSVREFKDSEIDKKNIEKLIENAEKAPSSSNLREREYHVLTDKAKIEEIESKIIHKFYKLTKLVNPFVIGLISIFNKKSAKNLTNLRKDLLKIFDDFNNNKRPVFRDAPCVICISAPENKVQSKDDCIIAQQYMMLFAHTLEIGSCIIGYAQYMHKIVEKSLNISKKHSVYAVSIFGYQKYMYEKEIIYKNFPKINWY